MKKKFSGLTVGIIAFLMLATGVAANDLYREWAGSDDFRQTEENLNNIQKGVTDLQITLENTEGQLTQVKTDLADKEKELEEAKSDSNSKKNEIVRLEGEVEDLNSEVSKLKTERTKTIALIKTELQDGITEVNGENGPRHKYDKVKEIVNEWADKLGLAPTSRLVDHGTSKEYDKKVKDLEQAEKDMESLKNQSGEVLKSLNTDTEEETEEEPVVDEEETEAEENQQ